MATGTVFALFRWPVKSLGGEPVDALRVDRRGAAGDRAHAVLDTFKGAPRRLTAREMPRMLAWRAHYGQADVEPADVPLPMLAAPGGESLRWDDPQLTDALGADFGRAVTLRRDLDLMQDVEDSLLVTSQATLQAVGAALDGGLDVRRFRPNLHLALDAPAFAEERWAGRALRVGEVELELLDPCERCAIPTRDPDTQVKDPRILKWLTRERDGLFGIHARAHAPGRIAVGDSVEVV
jgi:MOSC domain-containing protein